MRICICLLLAAILALAPAAGQAEDRPPIESHLIPHRAAELGFSDFKGALHNHSYLSHDSEISHADVIAACNEVGLDFCCMTDHPSEKSLTDALRGRHGRTTFLSGAEVNHFLGIDLREPIGDADSAGTVERIHAQGGLAFVAHSEEFTDWDTPGYVGMEIYNIHTDLKDELDPKLRARLARKVALLLKEPEWGLLVIFNEPKDLLARWDRLTQQRRVVGIAANDAHQNVKVMGLQLDPYARSIGFVNTHILAADASESAIKDALRNGHCYVCFSRLAPGAGFSFTAENRDAAAVMGDEIAWTEDLVLRVALPQAARLRLLRNGEVVERAEGDDVCWAVPSPGVYRVEAQLEVKGKWRPWIYANPIYVR